MNWFALNTAQDLFAKLQRDYQALQDNPMSSDHAFNFFVTAWHLLDWKYPDSTPGNSDLRKVRRDAEPLLQLVDHIANGFKHFALTRPRHHQSIQRTGVSTGASYFGSAWYSSAWFAPAYWGGGRPRLLIVLDGPARAAFGDTITVGDLAVKVMDFWTAEMQKP